MIAQDFARVRVRVRVLGSLQPGSARGHPSLGRGHPSQEDSSEGAPLARRQQGEGAPLARR